VLLQKLTSCRAGAEEITAFKKKIEPRELEEYRAFEGSLIKIDTRRA